MPTETLISIIDDDEDFREAIVGRCGAAGRADSHPVAERSLASSQRSIPDHSRRATSASCSGSRSPLSRCRRIISASDCLRSSCSFINLDETDWYTLSNGRRSRDCRYGLAFEFQHRTYPCQQAKGHPPRDAVARNATSRICRDSRCRPLDQSRLRVPTRRRP